MDPKVKASFIPDKMPQVQKKVAVPTAGTGSGVDFLVVIAIAIFAVSIAMAAGVFLYDNYQSTTLEARQKQLAREKRLLNPASVRLLARLDKRLKVASEVLANHTAPTVVFDLLEALTLKSVYFTSFEYVMSPQGDITLSLKGVARSVNGVARQAEVFGENRAFINPIFSNLNLTDSGVEFDVKTNIDPNALRYVQTVTAQTIPDASQQPVSQPPVSQPAQDTPSL